MKRPIFLGLATILVWITSSSAAADQKAAFYVNLGFSHYKTGQYQKAVEQFEKALSLDKNYQNIYGLLGSALFQLGNMDRAIAAFKKQIEITPNVADYHYNLGLAYLKIQSYAEAIQSFKKVVTLDDKAVNAPGFLLLWRKLIPASLRLWQNSGRMMKLPV